MGVFARFLGKKSKVTEEPDTEAPAGTEPDGSAAEATVKNAVESAAEDAAEETADIAAEEAAGATAAKEPGEDGDGSTEVRTEPEPVAVADAESTEIPKQQSAKEAADNEVGEGART
ncbi:hypothetical protein AB0N16_03755 [Streptomyces sp. NPDC051105]|uniref:hypothetical protein n=1 Tax=Streptomyces sp. NPDC051105 TaxID=3154843 RepID=UPI003413C8B8